MSTMNKDNEKAEEIENTDKTSQKSSITRPSWCQLRTDNCLDSRRRSQPKLSYEDLTRDYPRYPDIQDLPLLTAATQDRLMDVKPYMNPCPYTVYPNTPVPQVFNLFRSLGLRHLPVVDHRGHKKSRLLVSFREDEFVCWAQRKPHLL